MKVTRLLNRHMCLVLSGITLTLLIVARLVSAQGGGSYDLANWVVSGGGNTVSSGGSYRLGDTIGQPAAGRISGGVYVLSSGFWHRAGVSGLDVYLPLVLKDQQ